MTIEDIDYLIANSEPASVNYFIDSSNRDKLINPNPNSFVLDFSEPIKNVYGFEVLDATIPVTMYNIDNYNNIFAYSHVFYNTVTTPTQFANYLKELESCENFSKVFEANDYANIFFSINAADFDKIKVYEASINPIPLTYSNNLAVLRTEFDNLEFSTVETLGAITFQSAGITYYLINPGPNPNLITLLASGNVDVAIISNTSIVVFSSLFLSMSSIEHWINDVNTQITNAQNAINNNQTPDPIDAVWDIFIANIYLVMELGNYDGTSLYQFMAQFIKDEYPQYQISKLEPTPLTVTQTTKYGSLSKQFKMKFTYQNAKYSNSFILDMNKSTSRDIFGFSGYSNEGFDSLYRKITFNNNTRLFMSLTDSTSTSVQYIEPEGIINLQGIRYILLRIPEIETHLLGSSGYTNYTPGAGMFKLAAVNDITNLRFDFVNLIKKPFHPIGKLPKLTLRFTLESGDLYDFKGVDYNLLITIKYYAPKTVSRLNKSILNPNYTPDFIEYSTRTPKRNIKKSYNQNDILKEQNKYDYDDDEDVIGFR